MGEPDSRTKQTTDAFGGLPQKLRKGKSYFYTTGEGPTPGRVKACVCTRAHTKLNPTSGS